MTAIKDPPQEYELQEAFVHSGEEDTFVHIIFDADGDIHIAVNGGSGGNSGIWFPAERREEIIDSLIAELTRAKAQRPAQPAEQSVLALRGKKKLQL